MEPDVHIAGVLVQALPDRCRALARTLHAWPNIEVRAVDDAGRLVVVAECASSDETLDLMARMRDLPGVMNVALVYQHAESAGAMEQEIRDESDPPRVH